MSTHAQKFVNDLASCDGYSAEAWNDAVRSTSIFETASEVEIHDAIDAILETDVPANTRAQLMLELLLQAIVKRAHVAGNTLQDHQRIALFYRHLGPVSRSRAFLLRLLTDARSDAALTTFCELLIDDPPVDSAAASIGFVSLFRSRDIAVATLFPRLLDAVQHLSVAGLIIDLANYVTRNKLVAAHPGNEKKTMLFTLLGQVSQRLEHLEETARVDAEEAKKNQKKISESVALTVSLCDAAALIGDKEAIPKLNQALALRHRRIRTEAAAALARLGDEQGVEVLVAMAAEPVARLRVLAYAAELELENQIDAQHQTDVARAESELAVWLADPTQMGIPPSQLELFDSTTQYWPSYEEPRVCWLFQFTYQLGNAEYTNIGMVGPATHAFDVDVRDLPPDDIYAMFAGWQTEHEEILEFPVEQLTSQQLTHVQRLLSRLPADEYQNLAPLTLGSFFGDLTLLAACERNEIQGFVVIDSDQVAFWELGATLRPFRAEHVYWLYKGRRLLQAFN